MGLNFRGCCYSCITENTRGSNFRGTRPVPTGDIICVILTLFIRFCERKSTANNNPLQKIPASIREVSTLVQH